MRSMHRMCAVGPVRFGALMALMLALLLARSSAGPHTGTPGAGPAAGGSAAADRARAASVGGRSDRGARSALPASRSPSPSLVASYLHQPLMFEANEGQAESRVQYLAHGRGYALLLEQRAAVLALALAAGAAATDVAVLRLEFIGANPATRLLGREPLRAQTNYLLGRDRSQWHTGVANYAAAAARQGTS